MISREFDWICRSSSRRKQQHFCDLYQAKNGSSLSLKQTIERYWTTVRHFSQRIVVPSDTLELSSDLTTDVADLVKKYGQKSQTSASLQTLMRTGRGEMLSKTYGDDVLSGDNNGGKTATEAILMQVASFLRHELPIRLAHRIQDLDKVPLMSKMPSVKAVKSIYINSFIKLTNEPPIDSINREAIFASNLEELYERHKNVLIQMARGAYELRAAIRNGDFHINESQSKSKSSLKSTGTGDDAPDDDDGSSSNTTKVGDFEGLDSCHSFLDRFYMSRIGIRVLAGQYLTLRHPPLDDYVGLICLRTSPYAIVRNAVDDATFMCCRKYGDAPEVVISGRVDLTFPYIPTHLQYVLLELLKNAMRATVEHHGINDPDRWPPIVVIIADGKENEDVVIKVADEGGGIRLSNMRKIWSYLFTTADPSIQEGLVAFSGDNDHSADSPLAGLGYGLPISRSYVRYFGGDISLMSMEGYGTDAFVYLTRLGNSREPLPV